VSGDNGAPVVQWDQLRNETLRQRGTALLGPSTDPAGCPVLTCTATYTPSGVIRVVVDPACTLGDVHDLMSRIARACLNDDGDVLFSREGSLTAAPEQGVRGPSKE